MSPQPSTRGDQRRVLTQLRELIVALDKRLPQLQRQGERQIALDATLLKSHAQARIAAIEAALVPLEESGIASLTATIVR